MSRTSIVEAEMAARLELDFKCMEKGVVFEVYDENVLDWRRPRATERYMVRLDELRLGLVLVSLDQDRKKKSDVRYIPFELMSDLRTRPFTDETDETLVTEADLPCFNMIAYYADKIDFVNVLLISLLAPDADIAAAFRRGIEKLISVNTFRVSRHVSASERRKLAYARLAALGTVDGVISIKQVADSVSKDLREAVTSYCNEKLAATSPAGGKSGTGTILLAKLTLEAYMHMMKELVPRPDLATVFEDVAGQETASQGYVTAERLREFLVSTMRDPRLNEILHPEASLSECRDIIASFESDGDLASRGHMSLAAFDDFLASEMCDVLRPTHRTVYQDMTRPLAHYFISSSHNTYLTGGQLQSKSTPEMYRQVLLSGCRCIELDMWDPSDGSNEPIITHGKTLCSKVLFKKCIEAVRDYAFVSSDYPLILSFENHCTPPLMRKMATYCKEVFGELLLSEFMDKDGYNNLPAVLPSPEALRGRILIKNKRRPEDMKLKVVRGSQSTLLPGKAATLAPLPSNGLVEAMEVLVDGMVVREDEEEVRMRIERSGEIAMEMSALVNYITPFTFKGFDVARSNNCCYHMSSFSESKAMRFVTGDPVEFVDYNKSQLSRIYPNGTRVKSTNYNPQVFWNCGIQMVALNYQTLRSRPMQVNLGTFDINGRCGYIEKPHPMRISQRTFNPFEALQIEEIVSLNASVTVLSMQGIGRKDMQPVVEVQLMGLPTDTNKRFHTRPCRGRGLSPRWNSDNTVAFEHIILPEVAKLRFHVYDNRDQDHTLGWAVLPITSVQPGYRYIPLCSEDGVTVGRSTLFCKIGIELYVPDEHSAFIERLQNPTAFTSRTARNLSALENLIEDIDSAHLDAHLTDINGPGSNSGVGDGSGSATTTAGLGLGGALGGAGGLGLSLPGSGESGEGDVDGGGKNSSGAIGKQGNAADLSVANDSGLGLGLGLGLNAAGKSGTMAGSGGSGADSMLGTDGSIEGFAARVDRKLEEARIKNLNEVLLLQGEEKFNVKVAKASKKLVAQHQKVVGKLTLTFEAEVKSIYIDLRTLLKKDPNKARGVGHERLLAAELKLADETHNAFKTHLSTKVHPFLRTVESERRERAVVALEKRMAAHTKFVDKTLAVESRRAMALAKEASKGARKLDAAAKKNALKAVQALDRKLVTKCVEYKKAVLHQHKKLEDALEEKFSNAIEEVIIKQSHDLTQADALYHSQVSELKQSVEEGYDGSSIKWDVEASATAYLKHIKSIRAPHL